jgi:hypothetical protein
MKEVQYQQNPEKMILKKTDPSALRRGTRSKPSNRRERAVFFVLLFLFILSGVIVFGYPRVSMKYTGDST